MNLAHAIAWELQRSATYKPGYELSFRAEGPHVVFHLDARVLDSLSDRPNTAIGYTHVVPVADIGIATPQQVDLALRYVLDEVRRALHTFEKHESDEWFQVNHVQVHPPHQHYPPEQQ